MVAGAIGSKQIPALRLRALSERQTKNLAFYKKFCFPLASSVFPHHLAAA
jgi:hypothetical protein